MANRGFFSVEGFTYSPDGHSHPVLLRPDHDWAALYPLPPGDGAMGDSNGGGDYSDDEDDFRGVLSPRIAYRLYKAACQLGDEVRDDPDVADLPPVAGAYLGCQPWVDAFADCFYRGAARLALVGAAPPGPGRRARRAARMRSRARAPAAAGGRASPCDQSEGTACLASRAAPGC